MVVTRWPSAAESGSVHERTGRPFRWTVHAPRGNAAAVLGAGQAERFAQHPEQRHLWFRSSVCAVPLTVTVMAMTSFSRTRERSMCRCRTGFGRVDRHPDAQRFALEEQVQQDRRAS